LAINDNLRYLVEDCDSAHEAWTAVSSKLKPKDDMGMGKTGALAQLTSIKLEDYSSIAGYIAAFMNRYQKCSDADLKMDDEIVGYVM